MLKRVFYMSIRRPHGGYEDSPEFDTLTDLVKEYGEWIDKQESRLVSILSKFVNK